MANGHVEIHDLFSNHHGGTSPTDCDLKSTSDPGSMDGTAEFRLMMAYAKRRRPQQEEDSHVQDNGSTDANGTTPSQTPVQTETEVKTKKKKKKGWKRLSSILKCVKPQTDDKEPQQTPPSNATNRCMDPPADESLMIDSIEPAEVKKKDQLEEAVSRLTEIADEIPFTPPELETDSEEGEVEKMIGLLLRETGDKWNEKELKDANIAAELFWDYSFFKNLINALLMRMGLRSADPDALGPQASPKTQIAVTCEVTTRLTAVNTLPTNRLLSHGARYLQDYYSTWAQQQGGYEAAFEGDEDEVE
ncbi:uncharacterized protein LOC103364099 [Stegastes partitus]|uniref:Uncharacterized LOC103364099 n=1 Tax=Stegastes partitus TaxID=144197 RepID=A0A3B5AF07_9TELE|nr:PREDICTED: uncharacterized protein LOC103364099 [Stegastes partitus]